jgi:hypothetical protein
VLGEDHPNTIAYISNMGSLLEAAQPGKGYDAKAAEWKVKLRGVHSATERE